MTVHEFGPEVVRLLHRLDESVPVPPSFDDMTQRLERVPETRRSRRLLALAAAAVVMVGVGGLVWLQAGSEPGVDDVVTTQPGTVTSTAPPTSQPNPTIVASTAPSTTVPSPTVDDAVLPSFTRLMPTVLPDGFVLDRAIWERLGDTDIGYATFREDASDVVIGVTIRGQADFFSHSSEPVAVVGARPVHSGTKSGTCDGFRCALDVQWDDQTAVSVEWSSPSGNVEGGAIVDELVAIVRSLEPSPDVWVQGSLEEHYATEG